MYVIYFDFDFLHAHPLHLILFNIAARNGHVATTWITLNQFDHFEQQLDCLHHISALLYEFALSDIIRVCIFKSCAECVNNQSAAQAHAPTDSTVIIASFTLKLAVHIKINTAILCSIMQ